MTDTFTPFTRYPTETNNDYKYYGWYGPRTPTRQLWAGAFVVFVVIPVLAVSIVLLAALILVAIAVPPVGVAILTAGNS